MIYQYYGKLGKIYTRLTFIRDQIEPLNWDDSFVIRTIKGNYRMTKREFYDVFSNVVNTISYKENGIYHYPTTSKKAEMFRVK